MAQRHFNMSRGTLFVALLIVGILFQLIPHRHTGQMNAVFLKFFSPVLNVPGGKIPRIIPRPAPSPEDFVGKEEHKELWTDYQNAKADLVALNKKYELLAQVQNSLPEPGAALVLAQVITTSIDGYGRELIINRGRRDSLEVGQFVIGPNVTSPDKNSIIGLLSEVSSTTATVRLLTDLKSRIMVDIRRGDKENPIPKQMVGDGIESCKILLVSRKSDVQKGDTVYAATKPGFLATPVVIGKVSSVDTDPDQPLFLDITAAPVYKVKNLTDVAVIIMNPKEPEIKED